MRRFLRESIVIVALAAAAAFVSNATAGRERRLDWFGRPPVGASLAPAPAAAQRPAAAAKETPAAAPLPAPAVPAGSDFAPHPDKPFVEITPGQAKALFDRGALFIDARRSAAYREGHIRGARSISIWESDADEKIKQLVDEGRDAKAPIVAYCSGGDCEDSHELAQKLWGVTFDNVYVYRDGFPDWQKRGWPVAAGAEK